MNPPVSAVDLHGMLAHLAQEHVGEGEVGGDNVGPLVEKFQTAINDTIGHAWCASFVAYYVLKVGERTGVKSPLILSELVLEMWNLNVKYRKRYPSVGLIPIWKKKNTLNGHCGIIIDVSPKVDFFSSVEGNTSPGHNINREGDGVFIKEHSTEPKGGFTLLGYLDPFPTGGI